MANDDNIQAADREPPHGRIVVGLTAYGRARTVTPCATGLYCKLSIGHIDGDNEQEGIAQTIENLPPELYNAIFNCLEDDDVHFGDNLREIAEHIYASDDD